MDRRPTATTALVAVLAAGLLWLGAGVAAIAGWWPAPVAGVSVEAEADVGDAAATRDGPGAADGVAPIAVTGTAELLVATWLGAGAGDEARLRSLLTGPVDLTGVASGARYAARAIAVAANRQPDRSWQVTVAAEVLRLAPEGYVADGVRLYRVELTTSDGTTRARGLPEAVPHPGANDRRGGRHRRPDGV